MNIYAVEEQYESKECRKELVIEKYKASVKGLFQLIISRFKSEPKSGNLKLHILKNKTTK